MSSHKCPISLHLTSPPGSRRAWLELGSQLKANEELENIMPQRRAHADVPGVRWQVDSKAGKWNVCVDIADVGIKLDPSWLAPLGSTRMKGFLEMNGSPWGSFQHTAV